MAPAVGWEDGAMGTAEASEYVALHISMGLSALPDCEQNAEDVWGSCLVDFVFYTVPRCVLT